MIKTLHVCLADSLQGREPVTPVVLEIQQSLPAFETWSDEAVNDFYDKQASIVVEALNALPGGTRHRVLVQLLKTKVDHYRGTYL